MVSSYDVTLNETPRAIERVGRSALVIGSVAVALLFCELVLQIIGYRYSPLQIITATEGSDFRFYHAFRDDHFVFDPYLLWRPKPSYDVFNAQGYRGGELPAVKPSRSVRIFAIGDSNTLGWSSGGPNWPMYLDRLLAQLGHRFTVVNAGVWGYTSLQGLRRFTETLPLQPDLVLVSFGSNDTQRAVTSDAEYAARIRVSKLIAWSRVAQALVAAADWVRFRDGTPLVARVSLDEYRRTLREIVRLAHANHIDVVLLTRPFVGDAPFDSWKIRAPAYNKAAMEVASAERVLGIDVYALFEGKNEYFADESHFNLQGHKLAAELIYERIRSRLRTAVDRVTP